MHIDAAGSDDLTFARNYLSSWSNNYVDVGLHIGIASFADRCNTAVLDGDIAFHNSPVIQDQRVGDDRINRALTAGTLRLAHAVADDFSASELDLLAINREIFFGLDSEIGIREAYLVTDSWAKH